MEVWGAVTRTSSDRREEDEVGADIVHGGDVGMELTGDVVDSLLSLYDLRGARLGFLGNAMGAVGAPWVVDGIVANPPSGAGASASQLVQAMAGFGGGSGGLLESFDAAGLGSEASQQPLLIPPP